MILYMNRRYLVTVGETPFCYIVIHTKRDQMMWQAWYRTGTVKFSLAEEV